MKKNVSWLLIAVMLFPTYGYAHSPENIKATYSFENKVLTVSMDHLVDDKNDHFIRKIEIIRSGNVVKSEYYPKQEDIRSVVKNIPISFEGEEAIVIKAYSKKGGVQEKNFVVPAKPEKDSE